MIDEFGAKVIRRISVATLVPNPAQKLKDPLSYDTYVDDYQILVKVLHVMEDNDPDENGLTSGPNKIFRTGIRHVKKSKTSRALSELFAGIRIRCRNARVTVVAFDLKVWQQIFTAQLPRAWPFIEDAVNLCALMTKTLPLWRNRPAFKATLKGLHDGGPKIDSIRYNCAVATLTILHMLANIDSETKVSSKVVDCRSIPADRKLIENFRRREEKGLHR